MALLHGLENLPGCRLLNPALPDDVVPYMMPLWIDAIGWRYAFAPLALGPLFGVIAMARLRGHPDAVKLAGGRK